MSEYDVKVSMRPFLILVCALVLAACTALGVQAPQTFNDRALAATRTVQTVTLTASHLREQRRLSDADRDNVVQQLRAAEQGIDLAKLLARSDPAGGLSKLEAQIAVLAALQTYLATKGAR